MQGEIKFLILIANACTIFESKTFLQVQIWLKWPWSFAFKSSYWVIVKLKFSFTLNTHWSITLSSESRTSSNPILSVRRLLLSCYTCEIKSMQRLEEKLPTNVLGCGENHPPLILSLLRWFKIFWKSKYIKGLYFLFSIFFHIKVNNRSKNVLRKLEMTLNL